MPDKLENVGRRKKPEPSVALRMPMSIVKRVKMVALWKGMDPGDYAAPLLSKAIDEDEQAMLNEYKKKPKPGK